MSLYSFALIHAKVKHDFQVANQEISLILFEMSTSYSTADRIALPFLIAIYV